MQDPICRSIDTDRISYIFTKSTNSEITTESTAPDPAPAPDHAEDAMDLDRADDDGDDAVDKMDVAPATEEKKASVVETDLGEPWMFEL